MTRFLRVFEGCKVECHVRRPSSLTLIQLVGRLAVNNPAVRLDAEIRSYLDQHKVIALVSVDDGIVTATTLGGGAIATFHSERADLMDALSQHYNVVHL